MEAKNIRNAVRAIIIMDGKILLCKYKDKAGSYYACIGGGQNCFEDMHLALRRECKEEINSEINIGELVFVRETFFDINNCEGKSEKIHQIEHFFNCTLKDDKTVCIGDNPDTDCQGIEWVPISELKEIRIFPNVFKEYIHSDGSLENKSYIGLND